MLVRHTSLAPTDLIQNFHKPIFKYVSLSDIVAQFTEPRDIQLHRRERPKTVDEARLKQSNSIVIICQIVIRNLLTDTLIRKMITVLSYLQERGCI